MASKAISNTAVQMSTTPFIIGREATVVNLSAGSLTLQGSDDGTNYTTLATVGATAMADVTLPKYVKVSTAATLYLMRGA